MPVIQLRTPADYFGINEAPQQPLFQASQNVDPDIAFHRQMVGLRQQRPLAQAQAIQNQYSTIFNNAEKLRLEQQAAREAEQAVSALAGLTPEVDDYITQRQEIQRQFPNAMLDPRVQRIVDDNDRMFSARQSSLAKQQEDMMKRREDLQILGVPPDMAEKAAQSRDATAQLKFQYSKGSAKDITGQAMQKDLELIDSRIKMMVDAGTDVIQNEDGTVSPNPKFQSLVEKSDRLSEELSGFYESKYRPATTTPVAQEAVTPPAAPAAQAPFMDTMRKGAGQAPKVEDVLKVTEEEVIKDINSPDATDDTFMAALSDPNSSEKVKTTALSKLKEFAKSPQFPLGTTSREARNRIASLETKIKEGEKLIRMGPEIERYRKAWAAEKNDIASDIAAYAKSLGLNADLVAADLAKNEPLTDDPENPFTIRDDFNKFLKGKLDRKSAKLEPFSKSEFAKELGEKSGVFTSFTPTGLLGQAAQVFGILPNAQKSYGDILDVYLGEKFGQNQPATSNPVAPAVKPSNIKSITPIE